MIKNFLTFLLFVAQSNSFIIHFYKMGGVFLNLVTIFLLITGKKKKSNSLEFTKGNSDLNVKVTFASGGKS